MPTPDAVTQTVHNYLSLVAKGTADEVVELYTDDATVEDPIGTDLKRGRDEIRAFYSEFEKVDKDTELLEIRVGGSEAAFLWHLTLNMGDSRNRISPISVMTFDDDAKITSMKAYWSPSDFKPV